MYIHNNVSANEAGVLTFCGRDVTMLAEKYGTPLYLCDEERIRSRCREYIAAMRKYMPDGSMPLFASKALSFKRIYKIMAEEGMGTDIVSAGELYTARAAGFDLSRAFFHGNNKTDNDIREGIEAGVGFFVCDNTAELDSIESEARKRGIVQDVLLRLTPGIDTHTHKAIQTGKVDSKFGVAIETGQAEEFVKTVLRYKNIRLRGFHCHIGSQIFESKPFCDAAVIMLGFIARIKAVTGYQAEYLNLGGGLGVKYTEEQESISYAERIAEIGALIEKTCSVLALRTPKILLEPGRSIVADAGMTLYTVGGVKEIPGFRNYVSIDGGMPDNPRYALYQAPYTVMLADSGSDNNADEGYICTIAGRCCESGDLIAENIRLARRPVRGDILAVLVTGAYNYSMASNYNRIPRPPIVMLTGDGTDYIAVRRETYADLVSLDCDKNEIKINNR